jgi:hypothetical protein
MSPAAAGGPDPAATTGGGVDRPAGLRDTRFSVLEETAGEVARGGCDGLNPPNRQARMMLTTFMSG